MSRTKQDLRSSGSVVSRPIVSDISGRVSSSMLSDYRVGRVSSASPASSGLGGSNRLGASLGDLESGLHSSSFLSTLGNVLGNVPVIGGLLSPIFKGLASSQDKQNAYNQWLTEMQYNSIEAQKNRDYATSERIASQEFDMMMWRENNEYNSLASQLQRARDAGVNVNSIIGSGNSNVASQPVKSNPASGTPASYSSGLPSAMLTNSAMTQNLMAQTENIKADTGNKEYDLRWNKLTEGERFDSLVNANAESKARANQILTDIGISKISSQIEQGMYMWYSRLSEEDIKIKREQLNNWSLQNLDMLDKLELNKENKLYIRSQRNYTDKMAEKAEMDALAAQQGIYESQHRIALIDEQAAGQQLDNEIKEYEKELLRIKKEFSSITGIPINTPELEINLYLQKKGRMWDYYNLLAHRGLQGVVDAPGKILSLGLGGNKSKTSGKFVNDYKLPQYSSKKNNKSLPNPVYR